MLGSFGSSGPFGGPGWAGLSWGPGPFGWTGTPKGGSGVGAGGAFDAGDPGEGQRDPDGLGQDPSGVAHLAGLLVRPRVGDHRTGNQQPIPLAQVRGVLGGAAGDPDLPPGRRAIRTIGLFAL